MPRGGARNRSGPPLDPTSARSEARGIKLTALPSEGWTKAAPEFPLPSPTTRELEVWAQLWRTPQACAWALEPWRWPTVGLYCRVRVQCEDRDAAAALLGQLHRFADQVGLTPAGLKENGWAIAADQVAAKRAEREEQPAPAPAPAPARVRRLRTPAAG